MTQLAHESETDPRREQESPVSTLEPGSELRSSKRLIKIDYSYLDTDDDDDDLEVETEEPQDVKEEAKGNPWQRTGSFGMSKAEIDHYCDTALQRNTHSRLSDCCIL
uniref:50S ribosomal protein L6 n=1 Tax=Lygus hesperus TaxID=30085 RepID=A0A0A9YI33_LYGHE